MNRKGNTTAGYYFSYILRGIGSHDLEIIHLIYLYNCHAKIKYDFRTLKQQRAKPQNCLDFLVCFI